MQNQLIRQNLQAETQQSQALKHTLRLSESNRAWAEGLASDQLGTIRCLAELLHTNRFGNEGKEKTNTGDMFRKNESLTRNVAELNKHITELNDAFERQITKQKAQTKMERERERERLATERAQWQAALVSRDQTIRHHEWTIRQLKRSSRH